MRNGCGHGVVGVVYYVPLFISTAPILVTRDNINTGRGGVNMIITRGRVLGGACRYTVGAGWYKVGVAIYTAVTHSRLSTVVLQVSTAH